MKLQVIEGDGGSAIRRASVVSEQLPADTFVHIDPYDPYERIAPEALTPIELAGELAANGYRLFYWYGYESIDERGWVKAEISKRAPKASVWCGDMLLPSPLVFPDHPGVLGCGIVLANMTRAEAEWCGRLDIALERISASNRVQDNEPSRIEFLVI